ncbi:hypothetical protein JZ751_028011 [Albula glossodonta]|uniref:Uncharacterized protein n=1 Tax=Albula glossodonta TaxID=121402 RepID=A0A8T2P7V8_9TELE|nr:hypothetical protein JZ751_028011 [Albula glossodonta]
MAAQHLKASAHSKPRQEVEGLCMGCDYKKPARNDEVLSGVLAQTAGSHITRPSESETSMM